MVWAWMHYLSYALGTRTRLWFGHGCACYRMLSEHERYCGMLAEHERSYGLGMDALVIVCSRNTNVIMVWAWLHYLSYTLLSYALGTRTLLWFGHGCAIVCYQNTNVIMVWAWMHYLSYALGTRTRLWFGHGCACYRMLSEHERYCGMLAEHERSYGLGMDALVIVCSRNTNVIMVWAWLHYLSYTLLSYALGTRILLWFGHRDSMLSEHERYIGVGMDALVIVCSQNTNVIMVWAWMLSHSRSLFLEKRDAWYTQYFGPPRHFECAVRATQATSGEVGQVCIFCAFTLRRSQ